MKQRIYIDTSVIGGCFDEEFRLWSEKLFDEFRAGTKVAVVSDLTRRELEGGPRNVRNALSSLLQPGIENVFLSDEAEELAAQYLQYG